MSDQNFFFEDDKPAKAEKTSSKAPSKGPSKSASKGSAKSTAKGGGKSSSRPAGKKGTSGPDASNGQTVTMTLAIMFAIVSLFLGIIIGLYLPKLMGANIAPGSSTTAPAVETPSGSDRGIPDNHPDTSGGAGGMGGTLPQ